MSFKILLGSVLLLAILCVSAFAQQDPNDLGAQDSLYMTVTALEEGGNDSTFIAQVWAFVDGQTAGSAAAGFTWDNPRVQMDSAVFTDEALSSFDFVHFLYRNNILDSTNIYQQFQFAGSRLMGTGLLPSTETRLMATYYFHVTGFDPTEDICIDTLKFSTGTTYKFVDAKGNVPYIPYWTGTQCANTGPTPGTLVVNPEELNFTAEEGAIGVATQNFAVTELDGGSLEYTSSSDASWISLQNADGTTPGSVTVRPLLSGLTVGSYTDSVVVTSAGASNAPAVTINLEITQPNQAPEITPLNDTTVAEDQALALTVTAIDPDATTPSLTTGTLPDGASFADNGDGTGSFTWTPSFTQGGTTYDVIFIASDGELTDEDTVTITVTNVDRPPVLAEIGAKMVAEEAELAFTTTATDPDIPAQTLTFSAVDLPTGATYTDGGFAWTPTNTQSGIYDVWFIVSDGELADSELVTITVTDIDGLALTPDTLYFTGILGGANPVDQSFNIAVSDGSEIGIAVSDNIAWATIDPETGTTPFDVAVSVDMTGLAAGTYFDSLLIDQILTTAGVEEIVPVYEYINFEVLEPAKLLAASPDTLNLIQSEGAIMGASGSVMISEVGGTGIEFDISTESSWLDLSVASATTPYEVDVDVNTTELDPDTYFDSILVTSADAENSPIYVYVSLEVVPCPVLTPSLLEYSTEIFEGETASVERTVTILSSGGEINWVTTQPADYFTFSPSSGSTVSDTIVDIAYSRLFETAGEYSDTAYIEDDETIDDDNTCSSSIMVVVNVTVNRAPSADTVIVVNTPAVPGMRVAVPVLFSNSCPLSELAVNLSWPGNDIYLDSVSFAGGAIDYVENKAANIDNDIWTLEIVAAVDAQEMVPIGSQELLATLYFSLNCEIANGTYGVTLNGMGGDPVIFVRDCGEGVSTEIPEYIPGNVIVGEASNFVCGYVVDPEGNEIEGATVELWANFPMDSPEMSTSTSVWGSFGFDGIMSIPFDLFAYADGYYPNTAEDLNFGDKGVVIVLTPMQELVETSQWVDYYCPDQSNLFLGAPIPVGSVVEAFNQGGLLVGQTVVTVAGQYGFMPVYRNWEQPNDIGAQTGDIISFYINQLPAVAEGDVVYPAEYAQQAVCLEVRGTVEKECTLFEGWNLISWNVNTDSDNILDVLAPIMDYVDVVLGFEQGGLTFDPHLQAFSTLWNVDHLSGYWVKIEGISEVTLSVSGLPVMATTPIPLSAGWNLVSYLPEESMPIDDALLSVSDNLVFAYGFPEGNIEVYEPQGQFNQLATMDPCNGYWLKVDHDGQLTYEGNVVPLNEGMAKTSGKAPLASGSWVNLYSENLTVDGKTVNAGAVITARSVNGDHELGSYTMTANGKFGFMPVYADAAGEDQFGLKAGESFYLTVDGIKTEETFEWTNTGARIQIAGLVAGQSSDNLPLEYSLNQNYPNPFNPTTTIQFTMPANGRARVEVFNILGRLIATPFDGQASVGVNQVVWDGRSSDGETAASGVYFYRLTADNYTETRKMMLLK